MSATRHVEPITAEQIRLLTLSLDATTNAPSFRLETFKKTDRVSDYVAVSYAWQAETPVTEIRLEDGRSLPLSATLAGLIDALQSLYESVSVWIDAICINQSDNVEKAEQVRSMGDVYANAKQVVVWLGREDDEAKLTYEYMLSRSHLDWPKGWEAEEDHTQLRSILRILKRPWFRRLWVIQEVVLGRDVLFVCGALPPMTLEHFTNCTYAIWRYCQDVTATDWEQLGLEGLRCFSRLLAIRHVYIRRGEVPYELLLQAGRFCETTDPRDKIFGLQGVARPCLSAPSPDYSVPLAEIAGSDHPLALHTRMSRALLCHGNSLDSLSLAGLDDRDPGLHHPSWVMNLQNVYEGEPLTMADKGGWYAGGTVPSRVRELSADEILLQVSQDEEVEQCCRPFVFDDFRELQACITEVMDLRRFLSPQPDTQEWKERVMTSMLFSLNMDENPITNEECLTFDEWLQMVLSEDNDMNMNELHENVFHRTAYVRIEGWRAGLTRSGDLFMGPALMETGDCVVTLPGCRFPLALRKHGDLPLIGDKSHAVS